MPDAKTRFIITDPCYLIDDDAHPDAWSHFCELSDSRSNWEVTQQANEYLSGELGFGIVAASTGFGDWSNCIEGEGVVNMNFFADAGMVCVAEIPKSALVQERIKDLASVGGVAIFEADCAFSDLRIEMDRSVRKWTVVRVYGPDGNLLVHSLEDTDDMSDDDNE